MTMRLLVAALPLADAATMTWTAGAVGYFDVANNWDGGEVPGSSDTMVLADGTVYLAGDATINNLKMSGGELVVGSSECPDGWSTTLTFDGCVRAYATPKTWLEAEEVCHGGFRGNGKVALQSTTTITTCVSRSGDGDECPRGSRGDGAPDRFQPAHLRDAVVVEIDDGAWSQGDLLMGEGATLKVAQGLAVDDDASDRSPRIFATARDATPGREDDARNGWYSTGQEKSDSS